jgi:hypothetical protein
MNPKRRRSKVKSFWVLMMLFSMMSCYAKDYRMADLLDNIYFNLDTYRVETYHQFFSKFKVIIKQEMLGAQIDEDLSVGLGARPTLTMIEFRDNLRCSIQAPTFQKYKNYRKSDTYYLTRTHIYGKSGWTFNEVDLLTIVFKFSNDFIGRNRPNAIWILCQISGVHHHYFGYRDLLKEFKQVPLMLFNEKLPLKILQR